MNCDDLYRQSLRLLWMILCLRISGCGLKSFSGPALSLSKGSLVSRRTFALAQSLWLRGGAVGSLETCDAS